MGWFGVSGPLVFQLLWLEMQYGGQAQPGTTQYNHKNKTSVGGEANVQTGTRSAADERLNMGEQPKALSS